MRAAIAFGLLTVAAAGADAKPVDEPPSAVAVTSQLREVGECIAAHPPGPDPDPQDGFVVQNCECAVDRFLAGRPLAELRTLRGDPKRIEEHFAACRAERAGGQDPVSAAAEANRGEKDPEAAASPGLGAWLRGLDPAGWLGRSGLPAWAWAAIAGFALLLVLTLRGRRPRGDLIAPPRSLGPSPQVNPVVDDRAPDEDARPGG